MEPSKPKIETNFPMKKSAPLPDMGRPQGQNKNNNSNKNKQMIKRLGEGVDEVMEVCRIRTPAAADDGNDERSGLIFKS